MTMRFSTGLLAFLVTATALAFAPEQARAEVFFKETQTRYDLGAGLRSKREIWNSVKKRAPKHDGRTAIGVAQGKPRLNYKFERKDGRCTVTELQMQMHVNLLLPRWDGIYSAKPELKAYYRCIKKTVVVHEREHSRIWYETAKRADRKLKSVLRDVPCSRFKALATKHFRGEITKGSQRQAAFDTADYARRRYQRCHAITARTMKDAVRYTKAHQEWEPPSGRTAPQWSRPAVERKPIRTRQTGRKARTYVASDTRGRPTEPQTVAPQEAAHLSPTVWITALLLCALGAFAWLGIARPYLAAEFQEDERDGAWADKIVLPDGSGAKPGRSDRKATAQTNTPAKPTFGKRGR